MTQWKSFWERLGNWELWPFALRYALISPVWGWYCLRSGSLWFFSASNPTITFGGFEGEGKREMYEQLPPEYYPKTAYVQPRLPFSEVQRIVRDKGFSYPFIVKPDVGMKGLLFRKIDREEELKAYHDQLPFDYIIQELVTYPLEVSIFYYRYPDRQRGVISGFIQKDLLDVYGDGRHTLMELILTHPKARHRLEEMRIKHGASFEQVIPAGERYILAYAANLNRGATFSSLERYVDDRLTDFFDAISHRTQFYYGRYDIKCASVEGLLQGKNFTILEFNGAGAEPNHVYHTGYSLIGANKVFLRHWKALYGISRYNHKHGHPYWSFSRGWRFLRDARRHLAQLEQLEKEIKV